MYDSNGNLSQTTEGSNTWGYEWNANNELTRVTKNSVEQARFAYDPIGRRVEKVAGGVTTSYAYDGHNILREVRGSNTLKYVHGPTADEPLALDDGTSLSSFHADGLGSVIKTTNASGAVVSARRYDAWGNLEIGAGEPGYSFTGREWDPEVSLYYYRARYYDSRTGRFVSEDPLKWKEGTNFFLYVHGNPVIWVDPSGKACCPKDCPSGNWFYNAGFGAQVSLGRGGSWSWGEYQCADPEKWFVRKSAYSKCKSWGLHFDIGVSFDQQYRGSAVSGVYCKEDLPPVQKSENWNITVGPANFSHGGPPRAGNFQGVSGSPSMGGGINKQWCEVFLQ